MLTASTRRPSYARKAVDTLPAGDAIGAVHACRHHPDGRNLPRIVRDDALARDDRFESG